MGMRKKMSIESARDKSACAANPLPLFSVRVFRIGADMSLKARGQRPSALFKVAAVSSGIILTGSTFVFRSTKVAI
jgi:hypothetical protein